MRTIQYVRTVFAGLLLSAATLLAFSPVAMAHPAPPPADGAGAATGVPAAAQPEPSVVVTHHGSPVWTFVVVAIVAIALTLAVQVLLTRIRPALRHRTVHA
ncbi:MAG TPA: hypothetical protein VH373_00780 [Jatrophihabitantaceae bacterium]|jgi:hypothetical protein